MTITQLLERLDQVKRDRQAFVEQANQELAHYAGQIAILEELLNSTMEAKDGPGPD